MRFIGTIAMLFATMGCSDISDNAAPTAIETPDGKGVANKSTVAPTPQQINVVAGDELERLHALSERAPKFLASYVPQATDSDLKAYDQAFRAWQLSDNKQYSKQQVVEVLGAYLGNKCVANLDMEWVTVSDEYGTDYAVRSKTVEVIAFPFSTVLKRIENNEYDFLYGVYHSVKQTLESGDNEKRETELPRE